MKYKKRNDVSSQMSVSFVRSLEIKKIFVRPRPLLCDATYTNPSCQ